MTNTNDNNKDQENGTHLPLELYFPKLDENGRPVIKTDVLDNIVPAGKRLSLVRMITAVAAQES